MKTADAVLIGASDTPAPEARAPGRSRGTGPDRGIRGRPRAVGSGRLYRTNNTDPGNCFSHIRGGEIRPCPFRRTPAATAAPNQFRTDRINKLRHRIVTQLIKLMIFDINSTLRVYMLCCFSPCASTKCLLKSCKSLCCALHSSWHCTSIKDMQPKSCAACPKSSGKIDHNFIPKN